MRRRVFLAVLLALVLSLSKGSETSPPSTLTTTTTETTGSSSYTTPIPNSMTTTTETTAEVNHNITGTTSTTTAIHSTGSETSPPSTLTTTTTETTGSSSYTSPIPTSMTTTETTDSKINANKTGSSSDTTPIPNSTTTTTETTGSTSETTSNPSSPTTTGTTGSSSDTSPIPNSMTTTTETTGSTSETTSNPSSPTTTGTTDAATLTTTTETKGENDTTTAATPTTTAAVTTRDFCNPDPCGTNLATCVPLNSTFTCLCQYGFYYRDNDCHRGKIFPGVITVQGTYGSSVLIVNSTQYEEVFENITQFFMAAFENLTGFAQTVIVEIQLLTEDRAAAGMRVTVINLFMENTTANNETVMSAVMNATQDSSFVIQYTGTTYCAVYNCDAKTTVCEEDEFPQCICQSNFSKTEWDTLSCSDCSEDCSERENTYCARENGVPTCKCMTNFEMKDEKCVSCPVGYSGDNCKNNSELILIIVGTVFGAIILCLAIAVTVVSIRAKHRQDPEKKKLLRSGYSNPNTSDDRQPTMFPRVRTTTGHANPGYQPNNPYEMRDFDDLYEASREPEGFRMHNRN